MWAVMSLTCSLITRRHVITILITSHPIPADYSGCNTVSLAV